MTITEELINSDLEFIPDDESVVEVSDEYEYEEDDEEAPVGSPPRQPNSTAEQALQTARDEISELNNRLGNANRVHGERLKERDAEINEWLENVQKWHKTEIDDARQDSFEEGVRSVEKRLLSLLGPEEKADYLEDARTNRATVSLKTVPELDTKRKTSTSETTEDLHTLVQQFVAAGVPIDQLEQTSAEAVVQSGTKFLASRHSALEERLNALDTKLEGRVREDSGATRVSTGVTGVTKPTVSNDQRRLEEIERQLKVQRGKGNLDLATKLLNEKKVIAARLATARRRQT